MKIRIQLLTTLLCLLPAVAFGATLKFGGPIDQAQAGDTGSEATGMAVLTLDTVTGDFELTVTVNGLPDAITASHIHVDPSGDVVFGIGVDYTPTGTTLLSKSVADIFPAASVGDLLLGNTYVNIHTASFPAPEAAEIRGQLLPMDMSSDSLVNFSTRGMVNPGNGKAALLIGGLALQETKTILFRMVAESMTRFGVQTSLKDTSFEVFRLPDPGNNLQEAQLIGGNDNWKEDGQQFMIAATGYAPAFDNESAWIMTLGPGVYTMNANSEQGAGIALVETYGVEMGSIADVIKRAAEGELNKEFTILSEALKALVEAGKGELAAALAGPGPFTFFAPTDEAFLAAFPGDSLGDLVTDASALETALLQHIVSGKILAKANLAAEGETVAILAEGDNPVTDLNGNEYNVTVSETGVTVANANVIEADLILSNGVIHVIDAVIQLP